MDISPSRSAYLHDLTLMPSRRRRGLWLAVAFGAALLSSGIALWMAF